MSRQPPSSHVLFVGTLTVILGVTVLMHVAGALSARATFWGVHHYAFFHPSALIVATALLLLACAFVMRRRDAVCSRFEHVPDLSNKRTAITVGGSTLLGGVLFWIGRARHTYLGDGNVLIDSIPTGQQFHPREPLTMLLQHLIHDAAAPAFGAGARRPDAVAHDALALGSVLAGMLFIVVAWILAREIAALMNRNGENTSRPGMTALMTAIILAQGYIMLFFGYVENYAFYTVALAFYLWAALRFMRGRCPLLVPALALIVAMALHLVGVILVPSFGVLVVWTLLRRSSRVKGFRDLAIGAVAFFGLVWIGSIAEAGYNPFSTLLELTGVALTRKNETVSAFSPTHLRNFVNEQLLIGPLGLMMFIGGVAAAFVGRTQRAIAGVFLIAAGAAYFVASVFAGDSNLGYARDWDVWAPGGVVFTTAGLGLFALAVTESRRMAAPLLCALIVSLYHTIPWIAVNASEDRALARLKVLPLGLGRSEVLVGTWYERRGDTAAAKEWYEQAIRTNRYNNNAYYLLASVAMQQGNFDLAVRSLENSVALRPDKLLFRESLVRALFLSGRGGEAIPHLDEILKNKPQSASNWALYGEALKGAGRPTQARLAFEKALPLNMAGWQADPGGFRTNFGLGNVYFHLDRYEESLRHFDAAVKIDPARDSAWCYAGYALKSMGRVVDAAQYFRRCFSINPTHPDRAQVEKWIREEDG